MLLKKYKKFIDFKLAQSDSVSEKDPSVGIY